jgi:hypothetical protein
MAKKQQKSDSGKDQKPKEQDPRPVIRPEYLREQKKEKEDANKRLNEDKK